MERLELGEESARAVERMLPRATLCGARLEAMPAGEPIEATADPLLVARILDSLILNGLTYTEWPATVLVEVGDARGPFVRIRDSGLGMDCHTRAHAFDHSFRGDPDDGERPGSGLGLYLSRRAAERMGATLEVEWSHPGLGTSFLFRLRPACASLF
jgi:signal transduction histidine kinase